MQDQFLQAARPEAVYSRVIPDICPVAAGIAKAKGVQMRRRSELEYKYELVLRSIEASHAAIGLVPDADVFELGKHFFAGGEELGHVAPVHADERSRAVPAAGRCRRQTIDKESGEGPSVHFADTHGKVTVADAPGPAHMAIDRNIVRRVGEDQSGYLLPKKPFIGIGVPRISADEPMPPEGPKVSRSAHRGSVTLIDRDRVLSCGVGAIERALSGFVEHNLGLGERKSGDLDVEIKIDETL